MGQRELKLCKMNKVRTVSVIVKNPVVSLEMQNNVSLHLLKRKSNGVRKRLDFFACLIELKNY